MNIFLSANRFSILSSRCYSKGTAVLATSLPLGTIGPGIDWLFPMVFVVLKYPVYLNACKDSTGFFKPYSIAHISGTIFLSNFVR